MFIVKIRRRIRVMMKTMRVQYDESQQKVWKTQEGEGLSVPSLGALR